MYNNDDYDNTNADDTEEELAGCAECERIQQDITSVSEKIMALEKTIFEELMSKADAAKLNAELNKLKRWRNDSVQYQMSHQRTHDPSYYGPS